ncbi:hypothetical protein OH492_09485 [Vibrio chagasii]|nr:hypothetical protein [Vibrio chagasii]
MTITANDASQSELNKRGSITTGLIQERTEGDDITLDGLVFTGWSNERFGAVRMMVVTGNTLQKLNILLLQPRLHVQADDVT